jgi:hypothetical protein
MAAVNETCACGSTLTYSGDSLHTSWAMRDFRSAHEGCRTPAPTPSPPPVAEPSCTCSTDPLDRMPLIDGRCPVHARPTINEPTSELTKLNRGTCPTCGEFKFIGHGPQCTDCFQSGRPAEVRCTCGTEVVEPYPNDTGRHSTTECIDEATGNVIRPADGSPS